MNYKLLEKIDKEMFKKGFGRVSNIKELAYYINIEDTTCYIQILSSDKLKFFIKKYYYYKNDDVLVFESKNFSYTQNNLGQSIKTIFDFYYKFKGFIK